MRGYWLRDWLDSEGITTIRRAQKALRDSGAIARLRTRVLSSEYTTEPLPDSTDAIVAGRRIDLSNDLECAHWNCKRQQVDRLFGRVWHYFDNIVVVAAPAGPLQKVEDWRSPQLRKYLEEHLRMLIYVRQMGAETTLIFRQKPPPCSEHMTDHLKEAGLAIDIEVLRPTIRQLAAEARVGTFVDNGERYYYFTHPMFEHTVYGHVHDLDTSMANREFDIHIAEKVVQRYLAHLAADARSRKYLGRPLACAISFHGLLLAKLQGSATETDIALNLRLPVLEGVPIRELIRIRDAEKSSFIRFKAALRAAIRERLATAGAATAPQLAREIDRDVLEPALHEISQRLKAARSVLAKKAAFTIGLGTLATACGIFSGIPLLTTAGVGTAMSTLVSEGKYTEETRDVKLSDMYFLWAAKRLQRTAAKRTAA